MSLAQLGAKMTPVVSRVDTVDSYGNRTRSESGWADGTLTIQAVRYTADVANWFVGRKDREIFAWASRTIPDLPYLTTYRRVAFEHDERGFLVAVTREPPVQPWDLAAVSGASAQVMERNRADHELRTEFDVDNEGRVFRRDTISGADVRTAQLEFSPDPFHPFPTASVDEAGLRTVLDIDRNSGQMLYTRYPDGASVQFGYDRLDRLVEAKDRDGSTIIAIVAGTPGQTLVDGESPMPVDTRYVVSQREPSGRVTFTGYNGRSQPVLEVFLTADGTLANMERSYDASGNLTRESVAHESAKPAPATTTYAYDELHRLREVVAPGFGQGVRVSKRKYAHPTTLIAAGDGWVTGQLDDVSLVVATEDARGFQSGDVVGLRGQLVAAVEPEDLRTDYFYGPYDIATGTETSSGGAAKASTGRATTVYGWPTQVSDSSTGTHRYAYNRFGDLVRHTDAASRATQWTYDALGRPLTRSNDDGLSSWNWDCKRAPNGTCLSNNQAGYGKLAWSRSADGHETEFAYDPTHRRLSRETYRIQTPAGTKTFDLDYGYNAIGELESLLYPESGSGRVSAYYQYAAGELMVASFFRGTTQTGLWRRGPERFGQRDSFTFGNGISTLREYDRRTGELSTLATWNSSNSINLDRVAAGDSDTILMSRWDLGYNENGDLDRRKELTAGEIRSSYDSHGRLQMELQFVPGSLPQQIGNYAYDALGNLTTKLGVGAYQYEVNRPYVVSRAGTNQYQHNANGSQTYRSGPHVQGGEQRLTYTATNQIRSVAIGTATPERYGYTADDTRALTLSATGHTAHVGRLFEAIQVGTNITYRHRFVVEGSAVAELDISSTTSDVRYFHLDWRASPTLVTGSSGQLLATPRYDSFGALQGASNPTGLGFTSHRATQGSGLIDMGGRQYDPRLGRFVSADPFIPAPGFSQAYNRYAYVYNNPQSLVDPTGFGPTACAHDSAGARCWDVDTGESRALPVAPSVNAELSPEGHGFDMDAGEGLAQANDIESERFDSASSLMGGASAPGALSLGERAAWTGAGLLTGAAFTAGTGYLLGGVALACPLCAVGIGGGMLLYTGYQLLDGGFRDMVNAGDRILSGNGTANDYFNAGALGGSLLRAPRMPSFLKAGGKDMAARLKLGIRGSTGGGGGTRGVKAVGPGPHAVESIPARGPARDFTRAERDAVNRIGEKYGCHTCGAPTPGTKRADWILDHQPPNAFNSNGGSQYLFPQCLQCSRIQGGEIRTLLDL